MANQNLYQRFIRMQGGGPLNAPELSDDIITTPSSSGPRFAAGTATLVSGAVVVATGLNTVTSFTATLKTATGFSTGATEVSNFTVVSIATGAVTVNGLFNAFATGAATVSVSGTATFNWLAFGT